MRVIQPFCDLQRCRPSAQKPQSGNIEEYFDALKDLERKNAELGWTVFNQMLVELNKLNVKYLGALLLYLRSSGAIHPWYGEYHKRLLSVVETMILEKTVLK